MYPSYADAAARQRSTASAPTATQAQAQRSGSGPVGPPSTRRDHVLSSELPLPHALPAAGGATSNSQLPSQPPGEQPVRQQVGVPSHSRASGQKPRKAGPSPSPVHSSSSEQPRPGPSPAPMDYGNVSIGEVRSGGGGGDPRLFAASMHFSPLSDLLSTSTAGVGAGVGGDGITASPLQLSSEDTHLCLPPLLAHFADSSALELAAQTQHSHQPIHRPRRARRQRVRATALAYQQRDNDDARDGGCCSSGKETATSDRALPLSANGFVLNAKWSIFVLPPSRHGSTTPHSHAVIGDGQRAERRARGDRQGQADLAAAPEGRNSTESDGDEGGDALEEEESKKAEERADSAGDETGESSLRFPSVYMRRPHGTTSQLRRRSRRAGATIDLGSAELSDDSAASGSSGSSSDGDSSSSSCAALGSATSHSISRRQGTRRLPRDRRFAAQLRAAIPEDGYGGGDFLGETALPYVFANYCRPPLRYAAKSYETLPRSVQKCLDALHDMSEKHNAFSVAGANIMLSVPMAAPGGRLAADFASFGNSGPHADSFFPCANTHGRTGVGVASPPSEVQGQPPPLQTTYGGGMSPAFGLRAASSPAGTSAMLRSVYGGGQLPSYGPAASRTAGAGGLEVPAFLGRDGADGTGMWAQQDTLPVPAGTPGGMEAGATANSPASLLLSINELIQRLVQRGDKEVALHVIMATMSWRLTSPGDRLVISFNHIRSCLPTPKLTVATLAMEAWGNLHAIGASSSDYIRVGRETLSMVLNYIVSGSTSAEFLTGVTMLRHVVAWRASYYKGVLEEKLSDLLLAVWRLLCRDGLPTPLRELTAAALQDLLAFAIERGRVLLVQNIVANAVNLLFTGSAAHSAARAEEAAIGAHDEVSLRDDEEAVSCNVSQPSEDDLQVLAPAEITLPPPEMPYAYTNRDHPQYPRGSLLSDSSGGEADRTLSSSNRPHSAQHAAAGGSRRGNGGGSSASRERCELLRQSTLSPVPMPATLLRNSGGGGGVNPYTYTDGLAPVAPRQERRSLWRSVKDAVKGLLLSSSSSAQPGRESTVRDTRDLSRAAQLTRQVTATRSPSAASSSPAGPTAVGSEVRLRGGAHHRRALAEASVNASGLDDIGFSGHSSPIWEPHGRDVGGLQPWHALAAASTTSPVLPSGEPLTQQLLHPFLSRQRRSNAFHQHLLALRHSTPGQQQQQQQQQHPSLSFNAPLEQDATALAFSSPLAASTAAAAAAHRGSVNCDIGGSGSSLFAANSQSHLSRDRGGAAVRDMLLLPGHSESSHLLPPHAASPAGALDTAIGTSAPHSPGQSASLRFTAALVGSDMPRSMNAVVAAATLTLGAFLSAWRVAGRGRWPLMPSQTGSAAPLGAGGGHTAAAAVAGSVPLRSEADSSTVRGGPSRVPGHPQLGEGETQQDSDVATRHHALPPLTPVTAASTARGNATADAISAVASTTTSTTPEAADPTGDLGASRTPPLSDAAVPLVELCADDVTGAAKAAVGDTKALASTGLPHESKATALSAFTTTTTTAEREGVSPRDATEPSTNQAAAVPVPTTMHLEHFLPCHIVRRIVGLCVASADVRGEDDDGGGGGGGGGGVGEADEEAAPSPTASTCVCDTWAGEDQVLMERLLPMLVQHYGEHMELGAVFALFPRTFNRALREMGAKEKQQWRAAAARRSAAEAHLAGQHGREEQQPQPQPQQQLRQRRGIGAGSHAEESPFFTRWRPTSVVSAGPASVVLSPSSPASPVDGQPGGGAGRRGVLPTFPTATTTVPSSAPTNEGALPVMFTSMNSPVTARSTGAFPAAAAVAGDDSVRRGGPSASARSPPTPAQRRQQHPSQDPHPLPQLTPTTTTTTGEPHEGSSGTALLTSALLLAALADLQPDVFECLFTTKFFPLLYRSINAKAPAHDPLAFPALSLLVHNFPTAGCRRRCSALVEELVSEGIQAPFTVELTAVSASLCCVYPELRQPTRRQLLRRILDVLGDTREEDATTAVCADSIPGVERLLDALFTGSQTRSATADQLRIPSPRNAPQRPHDATTVPTVPHPTINDKRLCFRVLQLFRLGWEGMAFYFLEVCTPYFTHRDARLRRACVEVCVSLLLADCHQNGSGHGPFAASRSCHVLGKPPSALASPPTLAAGASSSWTLAQPAAPGSPRHGSRRHGHPASGFLRGTGGVGFMGSSLPFPVELPSSLLADGGVRRHCGRIHVTILRDVLHRLVEVAISDPEEVIRCAALRSLTPETYQLLYPHDNIINGLFVALNDRNLPNRVQAVRTLRQLAPSNPPLIYPRLRNVLLQQLSDFMGVIAGESRLLSQQQQQQQQQQQRYDHEQPGGRALTSGVGGGGCAIRAEDLGLLTEATQAVNRSIPLYLNRILVVLRYVLLNPHSERDAVMTALSLLTFLNEESSRESWTLFEPFVAVVAQQLAIRDGDTRRMLRSLLALQSILQSSEATGYSYEVLQRVVHCLHSLLYQKPSIGAEFSLAILKLLGTISSIEPLHPQDAQEVPALLRRPEDLYPLPDLGLYLSHVSLSSCANADRHGGGLLWQAGIPGSSSGNSSNSRNGGLVHTALFPISDGGNSQKTRAGRVETPLGAMSLCLEPDRFSPFSPLLWPDVVVTVLVHTVSDFMSATTSLTPEGLCDCLHAIMRILTETSALERLELYLPTVLSMATILLRDSAFRAVAEAVRPLFFSALERLVTRAQRRVAVMYPLLQEFLLCNWDASTPSLVMHACGLLRALAVSLPELLQEHIELWFSRLVSVLLNHHALHVADVALYPTSSATPAAATQTQHPSPVGPEEAHTSPSPSPSPSTGAERQPVPSAGEGLRAVPASSPPASPVTGAPTANQEPSSTAVTMYFTVTLTLHHLRSLASPAAAQMVCVNLSQSLLESDVERLAVRHRWRPAARQDKHHDGIGASAAVRPLHPSTSGARSSDEVLTPESVPDLMQDSSEILVATANRLVARVLLDYMCLCDLVTISTAIIRHCLSRLNVLAKAHRISLAYVRRLVETGDAGPRPARWHEKHQQQQQPEHSGSYRAGSAPLPDRKREPSRAYLEHQLKEWRCQHESSTYGRRADEDWWCCDSPLVRVAFESADAMRRVERFFPFKEVDFSWESFAEMDLLACVLYAVASCRPAVTTNSGGAVDYMLSITQYMHHRFGAEAFEPGADYGRPIAYFFRCATSSFYRGVVTPLMDAESVIAIIENPTRITERQPPAANSSSNNNTISPEEEEDHDNNASAAMERQSGGKEMTEGCKAAMERPPSLGTFSDTATNNRTEALSSRTGNAAGADYEEHAGDGRGGARPRDLNGTPACLGPSSQPIPLPMHSYRQEVLSEASSERNSAHHGRRSARGDNGLSTYSSPHGSGTLVAEVSLTSLPLTPMTTASASGHGTHSHPRMLGSLHSNSTPIAPRFSEDTAADAGGGGPSLPLGSPAVVPSRRSGSSTPFALPLSTAASGRGDLGGVGSGSGLTSPLSCHNTATVKATSSGDPTPEGSPTVRQGNVAHHHHHHHHHHHKASQQAGAAGGVTDFVKGEGANDVGQRRGRRSTRRSTALPSLRNTPRDSPLSAFAASSPMAVAAKAAASASAPLRHGPEECRCRKGEPCPADPLLVCKADSEMCEASSTSTATTTTASTSPTRSSAVATDPDDSGRAAEGDDASFGTDEEADGDAGGRAAALCDPVLAQFEAHQLLAPGEWRQWFELFGSTLLESSREVSVQACEQIIKQHKHSLLYSNILPVAFLSHLLVLPIGVVRAWMVALNAFGRRHTRVPQAIAAELARLGHFVRSYSPFMFSEEVNRDIIDVYMSSDYVAELAHRALNSPLAFMYLQEGLKRSVSWERVACLMAILEDITTQVDQSAKVYDGRLRRAVMDTRRRCTDAPPHHAPRAPGVKGVAQPAVISLSVPQTMHGRWQLLRDSADSPCSRAAERMRTVPEDEETSEAATLLLEEAKVHIPPVLLEFLGWSHDATHAYLAPYPSLTRPQTGDVPVAAEAEDAAEGPLACESILGAIRGYLRALDFPRVLDLWHRVRNRPFRYSLPGRDQWQEQQQQRQGATASSLPPPPPPPPGDGEAEWMANSSAWTVVGSAPVAIARYAGLAAEALSCWEVVKEVTDYADRIKHTRLRYKRVSSDAAGECQRGDNGSDYDDGDDTISDALFLDEEEEGPLQRQLDVFRSAALVATHQYDEAKRVLASVRESLKDSYAVFHTENTRVKLELNCLFQQIAELTEGIHAIELTTVGRNSCGLRGGTVGAGSEEDAGSDAAQRLSPASSAVENEVRGRVYRDASVRRLRNIACRTLPVSSTIMHRFTTIAVRSALVPPHWQINNIFILAEHIEQDGMPMRSVRTLDHFANLRYPSLDSEAVRDYRQQLRAESYRRKVRALREPQALTEVYRALTAELRHSIAAEGTAYDLGMHPEVRGPQRVAPAERLNTMITVEELGVAGLTRHQVELLLLSVSCRRRLRNVLAVPASRTCEPALPSSPSTGVLDPATGGGTHGGCGSAGSLPSPASPISPTLAKRFPTSSTFSPTASPVAGELGPVFPSRPTATVSFAPDDAQGQPPDAAATTAFTCGGSGLTDEAAMLAEYYLLEHAISVTHYNPAAWREFGLLLFDVCEAMYQEWVGTRDVETLINFQQQSVKAINALQQAAQLWRSAAQTAVGGLGPFATTSHRRLRHARSALPTSHLVLKSLYLAVRSNEAARVLRQQENSGGVTSPDAPDPPIEAAATTAAAALGDVPAATPVPSPLMATNYGFAALDFTPAMYVHWAMLTPLVVEAAAKYPAIHNAVYDMCARSRLMLHQFAFSLIAAFEHDYDTVFPQRMTQLQHQPQRPQRQRPRAGQGSDFILHKARVGDGGGGGGDDQTAHIPRLPTVTSSEWSQSNSSFWGDTATMLVGASPPGSFAGAAGGAAPTPPPSARALPHFPQDPSQELIGAEPSVGDKESGAAAAPNLEETGNALLLHTHWRRHHGTNRLETIPATSGSQQQRENRWSTPSAIILHHLSRVSRYHAEVIRGTLLFAAFVKAEEASVPPRGQLAATHRHPHGMVGQQHHHHRVQSSPDRELIFRSGDDFGLGGVGGGRCVLPAPGWLLPALIGTQDEATPAHDPAADTTTTPTTTTTTTATPTTVLRRAGEDATAAAGSVRGGERGGDGDVVGASPVELKRVLRVQRRTLDTAAPQFSKEELFTLTLSDGYDVRFHYGRERAEKGPRRKPPSLPPSGPTSATMLARGEAHPAPSPPASAPPAATTTATTIAAQPPSHFVTPLSTMESAVSCLVGQLPLLHLRRPLVLPITLQTFLTSLPDRPPRDRRTQGRRRQGDVPVSPHRPQHVFTTAENAGDSESRIGAAGGGAAASFSFRTLSQPITPSSLHYLHTEYEAHVRRQETASSALTALGSDPAEADTRHHSGPHGAEGEPPSSGSAAAVLTKASNGDNNSGHTHTPATSATATATAAAAAAHMSRKNMAAAAEALARSEARQRKRQADNAAAYQEVVARAFDSGNAAPLRRLIAHRLGTRPRRWPMGVVGQQHHFAFLSSLPRPEAQLRDLLEALGTIELQHKNRVSDIQSRYPTTTTTTTATTATAMAPSAATPSFTPVTTALAPPLSLQLRVDPASSSTGVGECATPTAKPTSPTGGGLAKELAAAEEEQRRQCRLAILRSEVPRHAPALKEAFVSVVDDAPRWLAKQRTFCAELAEWSAVQYLLDIPHREAGSFFVDTSNGHVATHMVGRYALQSCGERTGPGTDSATAAAVALHAEHTPHGVGMPHLLTRTPFPTTDPSLFRLTRSLVCALPMESPYNTFRTHLAQCLYAASEFVRDLSGITAFGFDNMSAYAHSSEAAAPATPAAAPPPPAAAAATVNPLPPPLPKLFDGESLRVKLTFEVPLLSSPPVEEEVRVKVLQGVRRQRRLDEAALRACQQAAASAAREGEAISEEDQLETDSSCLPDGKGETRPGSARDPASTDDELSHTYDTDDGTSEEEEPVVQRSRDTSTASAKTAYDVAAKLIQAATADTNALGSSEAPHGWLRWAPHW